MTAISGKTDVFENLLLLGVFQNADITGVSRGAAVAGSLYVSLHTADPTEEGSQTSSEIGYTSYVRTAVARSSAGWTVTGSSVVSASAVVFATCTGGSGTATHFGIGTSLSGAGQLLYAGAISPTIACANGVTPQITPTITEA